VLIPVAFFPKTGLDAYSPLATVVVGGLSVGTFLSLFVIPCLYTYVDDFGAWLSRRFRRQTREADRRQVGGGRRSYLNWGVLEAKPCFPWVIGAAL